MTLLDQAEALTRRMGELREARKFSSVAEDLEARRLRLVDAHAELAEAASQARILAGAVAGLDLPDSEKLAGTLQNLATSFQKDEKSLTAGRNFSNFERACATTSDGIQRVIEEAWKTKVHAEVPKTNRQFLDRLSRIRGMREAVDELQARTTRLRELSAKPPESETELSEYKHLVSDVTERVATLSTDRFPKAALDFCIAAQGEGATLDSLTDEVRAWLEQERLVGDLRYRFK